MRMKSICLCGVRAGMPLVPLFSGSLGFRVEFWQLIDGYYL
jgi:hypothetical protein